jgi:dUTP pyrophosphatase
MAGETPYLPAGAIKVFPTGVRVAIPPGFVGRIEGRSGMASRGVVPLGGLIDSGFTGPISIILANLSMTRWAAEPGTPIGQLVIFPILLPSGLDLRDSLDATERGEGGFGHTDLRS